MPQAKRHNKNCPICHKSFGSAKRHTIITQKYVNYRQVRNEIIVCGMCKSNLHNWQYKEYKTSGKVTVRHFTFDTKGLVVSPRKPAKKKKIKKYESSRVALGQLSGLRGNRSRKARLRWQTAQYEAQMIATGKREPPFKISGRSSFRKNAGNDGIIKWVLLTFKITTNIWKNYRKRNSINY
jgi:uncharacterized CHY-type Zn-finger protein